MQLNLPVFKRGLNGEMRIAIGTHVIGGTSLRVLKVEHLSVLIDLQDVRENRKGRFQRAWALTIELKILNVLYYVMRAARHKVREVLTAPLTSSLNFIVSLLDSQWQHDVKESQPNRAAQSAKDPKLP